MRPKERSAETAVPTRARPLPVWAAARALQGATTIVGARGVYLYDEHGKKYLDWNSGVRCVNLGHAHPEVEDVRKHYDGAQFVPLNMVTPGRERLCEQIAETTGLPYIFLPESGTGAVATAVQAAWSYFGGSRRRMLALTPSYHGGVGFVLELSGDRRRALVPPFHEDVISHVRAPIMQVGTEEALAEMEKVLDDSFAAIVFEPIIGTGGVYPLPAEYLRGVERLARERGVLLIADEIMSGCGRSGRMLAIEESGTKPDMVLLGKGLTNAVFPLAAVAASEEIGEFFEEHPVPAGSTFNAHPFGCAIASRVLEVLARDWTLKHVRAMERVLKSELEAILAAHPSAREFRLKGLFGALELQRSSDGTPFAFDDPVLVKLRRHLEERGLATLFRGGIIMCSPPLIIASDELRLGCTTLREGLRKYTDPLIA